MNSKRKGNAGERELARKLSEYGYDCRRGVQYKGGPMSPDVTGLPGIHIECKRVEHLNIYDAIAQSVRDSWLDLPAVFHRKNNCEWLVTMRLDDWMDLYREWEVGNDITRSGEKTEESLLSEERDQSEGNEIG